MQNNNIIDGSSLPQGGVQGGWGICAGVGTLIL